MGWASHPSESHCYQELFANFPMQNLNLPDNLFCCSMLIMYLSYLNISCKFTKPMLSFWLLAIHSHKQFTKPQQQQQQQQNVAGRQQQSKSTLWYPALLTNRLLEFLQVHFSTQLQNWTSHPQHLPCHDITAKSYFNKNLEDGFSVKVSSVLNPPIINIWFLVPSS